MTSLIDRPLVWSCGRCKLLRSVGLPCKARGPFLCPRLPINASCPPPLRPQLQAGRKIRVVEAPAEILLPPPPTLSRKERDGDGKRVCNKSVAARRCGGSAVRQRQTASAVMRRQQVRCCSYSKYVTESIVVMCGD